MPFNTLIFDLDGTLVDSAPDLTAALNAALSSLDLGPMGEEDVRHLVGHGARRLIERGLEHYGVPAQEDRVAALLDLFLTYYGRHVADRSRAFQDVTETLAALSAEGFRLGVCTNKPDELARDLLDQLNLSRFFTALRGGFSLPYKKPDGRHILKVIEEVGGDPRRAVMIGDSATDVNAARNAGVPVILVSFGYTPVPAARLGADAVIDHFGQLPDALPLIARVA